MNRADKPSSGSPNSASALPRLVLSEQVKDFVIEAIMGGELKPEQRVVERALARQLGVDSGE